MGTGMSLLVGLLVVCSCAACTEVATAVFQNGLEGYEGYRLEPDGDTFRIDLDNGPREVKVRFDGLAERLRCDKPRIVSARLELFYLNEWWTAYRYDVHCEDASGGDAQGGKAAIFGERTGKGKATPNKSFVAWSLPPELAQKWLDGPAANKGLRVSVGSTELLEADKGGGRMIAFVGNATRLARYRPRLVVEYSGEIRPEAPRWVTDLAGRQVGGRFILRWDAQQQPDARFDIESNAGRGWRAIATDLPADARQHEWAAPRAGGARLRIRTRVGPRTSAWREPSRYLPYITSGLNRIYLLKNTAGNGRRCTMRKSAAILGVKTLKKAILLSLTSPALTSV